MSTVINKNRKTDVRLKAFEEAREAVLALKTLSKVLTPAELETLEILLDKGKIEQISKSLKEAKEGKLEPIEKILK